MAKDIWIKIAGWDRIEKYDFRKACFYPITVSE
jgi:hypothetical protein